nr:XIAP-associated factor 1-like [Tanacetum cinerariifolium]
MDVAPDRASYVCTHCDRAIPSSNIDLHYAHCSRNLEKCKICDEMVPKKLAEEHYLTTHAPVSCSLCSEKMAPETLATHVGEQCSQRIVTCDYCEFPLPAIGLFEHQEICGNRTERCDICNRYIRLRERAGHEVTCNGAETSRASEAERERNARRRPPQDFSTRRLIFTIAVTGVAVVLGSLIFQRKPETSE